MYVCVYINSHLVSYIILQWCISTITYATKTVLLIIHLTDDNMKSLMKFTSLLLLETLSDSDYIMVYTANEIFTDNLVKVNSMKQQLIARHISKPDVTALKISVSDMCETFIRLLGCWQ